MRTIGEVCGEIFFWKRMHAHDSSPGAVGPGLGRRDELIRGLGWFSWLQKNDTCQQGQHPAPLILEGHGLPLCIVLVGSAGAPAGHALARRADRGFWGGTVVWGVGEARLLLASVPLEAVEQDCRPPPAPGSTSAVTSSRKPASAYLQPPSREPRAPSKLPWAGRSEVRGGSHWSSAPSLCTQEPSAGSEGLLPQAGQLPAHRWP